MKDRLSHWVPWLVIAGFLTPIVYLQFRDQSNYRSQTHSQLEKKLEKTQTKEEIPENIQTHAQEVLEETSQTPQQPVEYGFPIKLGNRTYDLETETGKNAFALSLKSYDPNPENSEFEGAIFNFMGNYQRNSENRELFAEVAQAMLNSEFFDTASQLFNLLGVSDDIMRESLFRKEQTSSETRRLVDDYPVKIGYTFPEAAVTLALKVSWKAVINEGKEWYADRAWHIGEDFLDQTHRYPPPWSHDIETELQANYTLWEFRGKTSARLNFTRGPLEENFLGLKKYFVLAEMVENLETEKQLDFTSAREMTMAKITSFEEHLGTYLSEDEVPRYIIPIIGHFSKFIYDDR